MIVCTVFIWLEAQVSISYKQFLTWHLYECYMGVCLLQSTEPQCLFEPSCLYEPCFYLDKYGMLLSFEWVDLSHQNWSDQTDFGRKFAKIGSPGPLLLPKLVWLHQFWQPKLVPLTNGPYSLLVCTSYFIFCSIHVWFSYILSIDCKWHWGVGIFKLLVFQCFI